MGHINKTTWGKSKLKFCPELKKVWQIKYDNASGISTLIIWSDMPTYGLPREVAPTNLKTQRR